MATETFFYEETASADIYIRLFNNIGEVFDFDDDTFKSLASATTPYKTATERADMAGTGRSGYTVPIDLATINDTGVIARYELKVYDNVAPADADNPVSSPLSVTVMFGALGERDVVAQGELSVKSTAGLTAQLSCWIEHGADKISLDSNGGTVFTAAIDDVITSAVHGLSNNDRVLLTTSTTLPAGLVAGTAYYVITSTTNTFKVSLTQAGAAVDITGTGTGVHKWHQPTCSVTVREHGSASNLFTATGDAGDLKNGVFEFEEASPNFVADRQYQLEVTISENGTNHLTHHERVIIG